MSNTFRKLDCSEQYLKSAKTLSFYISHLEISTLNALSGLLAMVNNNRLSNLPIGEFLLSVDGPVNLLGPAPVQRVHARERAEDVE
jgi:hypothetical protein